jgi:hypothetical protein
MYENDVEWSYKTIEPESLLSLFVGTNFIYGKSRLYSIAYLFYRCGVAGFDKIEDWNISQKGVGSPTVSKSIKNCIENDIIVKKADTNDAGKKTNEQYVLTDVGIELLNQSFKDSLLKRGFIKTCHIKYLVNFLNWRLISLISCMLFQYKKGDDLVRIGCKVSDMLNFDLLEDDIATAVNIIDVLIVTNTIRV